MYGLQFKLNNIKNSNNTKNMLIETLKEMGFDAIEDNFYINYKKVISNG